MLKSLGEIICSSTQTPLFIDERNKNFYPAENSPGIDQGFNLAGIVDDDFDNNLRPLGNAYDIGPYETASLCGNGICNSGETFNNCFEDCKPNSDQRLDYAGMNFYTTTIKPYDDSIKDVQVVLPVQTLTELPQDYTLRPDSVDFVNSYNPDFSTYDPIQHFDRFVNYHLTNYPSTIIATYISGRDCKTVLTSYPNESVDCSNFPAQYLFTSPYPEQTERFTVNISNSTILTQFSNLISNEAISRNKPIIYIDNIAHPSSGAFNNLDFGWPETIQHVENIYNNVSPTGIKVFINIGVAPWYLARNDFEDADAFGNITDGMTFEMPFHRYIRDKANYIEDEIQVYRRWLNNDKSVFLISVAATNETPEIRENRRIFLSAMAMIIRNPGDSIFVARSDFEERYPYINWSGDFGIPLEDYTLTESPGNILIQRQFQNGNISVQFVNTTNKKPVTFTLPVNKPYTIISSPANGTLNIDNLPQVTYTPHEDYKGVESFYLGANYDGKIYSDTVVVSVRIHDEEEYCGNGICEPGEDSNNCLVDCPTIPCIDTDGDGFNITPGCGVLDCNDTNSSIKPGAPDICNNINDDCDTSIDEDYVDTPTSCGTGACASTGFLQCTNGFEADSCVNGTPIAEICEGVWDDNCNGIVDDGCECTTGTNQPCGTDVGECQSGLNFCIDGAWNDTCVGEIGPTTEICDGLDNDCIAGPDNTFPNLGNTCSEGIGECNRTGNYVCTSDGLTTECNAVPGTPVNEVCDGLDNNCNGLTDEGVTNTCTDYSTCTTYQTCESCPEAPPELCNYLDDDCDSSTDEDFPNLGMLCSAGIGACNMTGNYICSPDYSTTDCSATAGTPTSEICDTIDNNCNGEIDENVKITFYYDGDNDNFGNASPSIEACSEPPNYVTNNTDCNDNNQNINPNATEICNGIDDNCIGGIDESDVCPTNAYYCDTDADGFNSSTPNGTCDTTNCVPTGCTNISGNDCNDTNANINLDQIEVCDGIDNNCVLGIDEGVKNTYYIDFDNDNYGDINIITLECTQPDGYTTNNTDCDDTNESIRPNATEICNQVDENCNDEIDEGVTSTFYLDSDEDTFGDNDSTIQACTLPTDYTTNNTDCNDNNNNTYPGATETCNGIDDNCNTEVDDGDVCPIINYYCDEDGDTVIGTTINDSCNTFNCIPNGCSDTLGYDCNDSNMNIYPSAPELCEDNIDNNCNNKIDGEDPECQLCTINSLFWSTTTASDKEEVSILIGAQNCTGKLMNVTVVERDILTLDDKTNTSLNIPFTPTLNWTALYQKDEYGSPEYYFIIEIDGNVYDLRDYLPDYLLTVSAEERLYEEITINLKPGKNAFSIPLILDNTSVDYVFRDIADKAEKIYTYDKEWEVYYFDHRPSNLYEIEPGVGYMLFMNQSATLTVNGSVMTPDLRHPQLQLSPGWKLLGTLSVEKPAKDILRNVTYEELYLYNESTDQYLPVQNETILNGTFSYWIYVTDESTLLPVVGDAWGKIILRRIKNE